ncbi:MAG: hypothetical protein WDO13_18145 [Verrucomicrobiota bacterium]
MYGAAVLKKNPIVAEAWWSVLHPEMKMDAVYLVNVIKADDEVRRYGRESFRAVGMLGLEDQVDI